MCTWTTLHDFARPVYWIAIDPNDENTMYASVVNHAQGLGGIYVTHDLQNGASSSWTKLSDPPRTEGHPAMIVPLNDGKVVCTFSARQTEYSDTPAGKFTKSSGVFIYNPVNLTWSDVTELNTMAWYCNDITVDPNDPTQSTWYVGVASGWGGDGFGSGTPNDQGGLFKTTDRGQNWTKLAGCFGTFTGGGGVFSTAIDPNDPNTLYISTTVEGLFVSHDINTTTPTLTQVSSFQFGSPLRILFNPYNTDEMWVTTFGNGLHVGNNTSTLSHNAVKEDVFSIIPNPSDGFTNIIFNESDEVRLLELFDVTGRSILKKEIGKGCNRQTINTSDLNEGIYLLYIQGTGYGKLVVSR